MNIRESIESIKSVQIKSTDLKRYLLMSPSKVKVFQSFLQSSIGNEVIVVNTNLGMEVYYYSTNDYSNFIKESVLLYTLTLSNQERLKFKSCINKKEVYDSFSETLSKFSQYPQFFLAYTKKFIRLQEVNKNSKFIMPVLIDFFEKGMQLLSEKGRIPYYQKDQLIKQKSRESVNDSEKIIKNLVSQVLMKMNSN